MVFNKNCAVSFYITVIVYCGKEKHVRMFGLVFLSIKAGKNIAKNYY